MLTCGGDTRAPALTRLCDRKPGQNIFTRGGRRVCVGVCVCTCSTLSTSILNIGKLRRFGSLGWVRVQVCELGSTLCLKVLTKIDRSTMMYTLTLARAHTHTRVHARRIYMSFESGLLMERPSLINASFNDSLKNRRKSNSLFFTVSCRKKKKGK